MSGAMIALHPVVSLVLLVVWFVVRKSTGKASVASLALTYLRQGAAGVVGSSTLSYGPVDDMGSADLRCRP